jgi:hypothetical protein
MQIVFIQLIIDGARTLSVLFAREGSEPKRIRVEERAQQVSSRRLAQQVELKLSTNLTYNTP